MNRKSVPHWRRSVTKGTASKNSSSNVNVKTHPRTGTERSGCSLKIEQISKVFRFICCQCLECLKSDLEFDTRGDWEPMQIGQNRCDVIALPGSRHHPCLCVDDSLQLVEIGGRCAVHNWVSVVNSCSNHWAGDSSGSYRIDALPYVA